jgi:membrane associated rhomboid family serine protease
VSTGGPDLFVICKNCGSEVSPYITECPYCGNRLRKRAPKLDRDGRVTERIGRRTPTPSLPRLRRGEIPGIRHDAPPYATLVLVALGLIGCLLWRTHAVSLATLAAYAPLGHQPWRVITSPFTYDNTGYAFVALSVTALYGTLMERRHGPLVALALFLAGAVGGTAVAVTAGADAVVLGGNGGALALLVAWAMQDLLALADGQEIEGDLLGTAVLGIVMALMPIVGASASWICDGVGILVGTLVGYPLARLHPA